MNVQIRKLTPLAILLFATIIASFTIIGNHGVSHLISINKEINLLDAKKRSMDSEISEIKNEIYALEHNPLALEKKARQELGLSKPNETIYVFRNN